MLSKANSKQQICVGQTNVCEIQKYLSVNRLQILRKIIDSHDYLW